MLIPLLLKKKWNAVLPSDAHLPLLHMSIWRQGVGRIPTGCPGRNIWESSVIEVFPVCVYTVSVPWTDFPSGK